MRTYIIFSHPVNKDKIYELMGTPDENIKEYVKDVVVDVYRMNQERFIVVKDGNHRLTAYLGIFSNNILPEIDENLANDLLSKVKVRSEKEITSVKEYLYFKQLVAVQRYVILHDERLCFSMNSLNKCINKGLIPTKISKDIIPFYYLYVYSDQTEGCGGYLKALLSITEDEDRVICSFQTEEFDMGMNFYGSDEFDTSFEGCDGDSYLFDNKTYLFKKEFKDGSLILNSDNEEINKLFNPLLTKENKEDDYFCYKLLLLDVFDSKFSDSVRFNGKPVPYGLCIFVGDFCRVAPI